MTIPKPSPPNGSVFKGTKPPRKTGNKSGGGGNIMNRIRQVNQSQTQALLHQLQTQMQQNRQELGHDIQDTRQEYRAGRGDMNYVHGQVRDYLNGMRGQMQTNFRNMHGILSQNSQGLMNQLQSGTDASRQAALQEQARLGIQQSGMGQFDADANNNVMMARQGEADAAQNLNLDQRGAQNVASLLGGMNQGSRASVMGQLLNNRNSTINDLRDAFRDSRTQVRGQMQQVRMEQAAALQQMLLQQMQQNQAYSRSSSYGGGGGYSSGGSDGVEGDPQYAQSERNQLIARALANKALSKDNFFTNKDGESMRDNPLMQGPMLYDPYGLRGPDTIPLGNTGYQLTPNGIKKNKKKGRR